MPLTAKILKTIEIVGHDAFLRWCRTPNREAYVARALHQTARDAVEAVAADLAAPVAVTRTPARDNPLTPTVVEMAAIALFRDLNLAERATPDVVALAWEGLTDPEREKWRSVVRKTFAAPARLVADLAFGHGSTAGRAAAVADALMAGEEEWVSEPA